MKIGLMHYTVPPVVGGVETVLGSHAALFRAAGHSVTIYAGEGAEASLPELRAAGAALAHSTLTRIGSKPICICSILTI